MSFDRLEFSGVKIFLDSNGNGSLDSAEYSALTDANGNFVFKSVPPGKYTVNQIVPKGYWQVFSPTPSTVTVSSGSNKQAMDFVDAPLFPQPLAQKLRSLQGRITSEPLSSRGETEALLRPIGQTASTKHKE